MELGKQIRRYRNERSFSQETLAEKVYVSRQTISNWENGKSYPDVNSLVLLSEAFEVSLDKLIKGDVENMKEQINREDQQIFNCLSVIYTVLLLAVAVTPLPLVEFLSYAGLGIWLALLGVALYVARLVEKKKKEMDVQTYKEIVAFMEGKSLNDIEKAREEGNIPYQISLWSLAVGAFTLAASLLFMKLLGM